MNPRGSHRLVASRALFPSDTTLFLRSGDTMKDHATLRRSHEPPVVSGPRRQRESHWSPATSDREDSPLTLIPRRRDVRDKPRGLARLSVVISATINTNVDPAGATRRGVSPGSFRKNRARSQCAHSRTERVSPLQRIKEAALLLRCARIGVVEQAGWYRGSQ